MDYNSFGCIMRRLQQTKEYVIYTENFGMIRIDLSKGNFSHIMRLDKLTDLHFKTAALKRVTKQLLNGDYCRVDKLEQSVKYRDISITIKQPKTILAVLLYGKISKWNQEAHNSLINADYVLSYWNSEYIHYLFFRKEKYRDAYYMVSYFVRRRPYYMQYNSFKVIKFGNLIDIYD